MEQGLLASRTNDAIKICNNSSQPKFIGFLRPEETAVVKAVAEKQALKYSFFGGYSEAERVFFGVFPEWCDDYEDLFPITALSFTFRKSDKLTHREFLGSFMSLGFARETVGDILIEEGRAVAFFTREVSSYVKGEIRKISNVGVDITEGFSGGLPQMGGFADITDTVASARLDCVVASLAGVSRSTATEFIEQKLITVNSVCCEKAVALVRNGDKITIRSKGKFIIESIDEKTKKGRLKISAKKYI